MPRINQPIETEFLLSHAELEASVARAFLAGRLHHSLLLVGDKGVGKATFAYRLARWIFAGSPSAQKAASREIKIDDSFALDDVDDEVEFDGLSIVESTPATAASNALSDSGSGALYVPRAHPIFSRFANGGVSDFKVLEPAKKTIIEIDQVRELIDFFTITASEDGWRIAVIDSLDEMNTHGRNALLKILEEPPEKSMLILLSHNPNGLLPTIKSRCRMIKFAPIANADMERLTTEYLPEIAPADRAKLAALSGGSIGHAAKLATTGGLELYDKFYALLPQILAGKPKPILELARLASGGEAFAGFRNIVLNFVETLIRTIANAPTKFIDTAQEKLVITAAAKFANADGLFAFREVALKSFDSAKRANLDTFAVVLSVLERLKNVR